MCAIVLLQGSLFWRPGESEESFWDVVEDATFELSKILDPKL